MRISSGHYRKQALAFPEKHVLRPTQDKVCTAVFNVLQTKTNGCRFLDLCCGTGRMGIEALSRGATHVHFVDIHTSWVSTNIKTLKPSPAMSQFQISRMRADRFLSACLPNLFDVIFCDPPWKDHALYDAILAALQHSKCLTPDGVLFIEHHRDHDIASQTLVASRAQDQGHTHGPLVVTKVYGYSDTHLTRMEYATL